MIEPELTKSENLLRRELMSKLKGKVVVITGASSGIGEETAISVAGRGGIVVISARREDRLKQIAERIKHSGGLSAYKKTDVTSWTEVQELAHFTLEEFGKIDVWINNAGIMPLSSLNKIKIEEWDQMIDVNIKGVLYGIGAAVPIMEKQKNGHIINISSIAGHRVSFGGAVYSGTKYAVRAITEGLRQELSPTANIRTTIISPGSVITELRETISDEDSLIMLKKMPDEVRLESNNIAEAIIYAIEQPENVSINEIIIRPTAQKS